MAGIVASSSETAGWKFGEEMAPFLAPKPDESKTWNASQRKSNAEMNVPPPEDFQVLRGVEGTGPSRLTLSSKT